MSVEAESLSAGRLERKTSPEAPTGRPNTSARTARRHVRPGECSPLEPNEAGGLAEEEGGNTLRLPAICSRSRVIARSAGSRCARNHPLRTILESALAVDFRRPMEASRSSFPRKVTGGVRLHGSPRHLGEREPRRGPRRIDQTWARLSTPTSSHGSGVVWKLPGESGRAVLAAPGLPTSRRPAP
jgi:hypothetical protein